MTEAVDRVWALHDFEAENPDEVSFKAGECILVVEKDDEYGDGWWQGTNERGEQGLFPFTYTTIDQALALQGLEEGSSPNATATPQGARPGVMHSTMADIDNALTELQGTQNGAAARMPNESSTSFTSEHPDDVSDSMVETDDFAGRSVAARAALAANAQKDAASAQQLEQLESQRMRAEAARQFEAEESRQRDLLLAKEKEHQVKLAAGDYDSNKNKVVPIDGVDMSDESDSEGSLADLGDFQDKTHSPLFGNLASTPKEGLASRELNGQNNRSLQGIAERNTTAPQPSAEPVSDVPEVLSSPAGNTAASLSDGTSASAETAPLIEHKAPLAAAVGALTLGTGAIAATASSSSRPQQDRSSITTSTDDGLQAKQPSIAADTATLGHGTSTDNKETITKQAAAPTSGGDPSEWSVEQVVQWARGKGWDESAIVSKFQEHEISGDVLLEMDINILKEIDISAFGKRFQVANAIKELRKQSPALAEAGRDTPNADSPALGSPALIGQPGGYGDMPMSANPSSQGPYSVRDGSTVDGRSPPIRMTEQSIDQNATAFSGGPTSVVGNAGLDPYIGQQQQQQQQAFGGPAGVAAWQAQQQNSRYTNDTPRISGDPPLSPTSPAFQSPRNGGMPTNRYSTKSTDDKLGALPSSPRKRESSGSTTVVKDRSSFFSLGSRNRKQPPMSAGSASSNGWADEEKNGNNNKGTLSRLGFARNSRNISAQSSQSTIKDQISLPTSSPQFDNTGDTARRGRTYSSGGGVRGSPALPSNMARPTSMGSAGPDAAAAPAAAPGGDGASAAADGPVMLRIQPVDLEGWIKKKGERYNTWKPRYLALKGPDLVILRDPRAEKIKGYINMKGYKVIADENTNPGKYGFKLLHESEKPHYFSSEDPILVREWMKALMKSTIGRDHSFPVISSYNNATISLKDAQRMNPPPRPPSPTSRARTQRAKIRPNPEQLTARDAAILMNLTSGQPTKADDPSL